MTLISRRSFIGALSASAVSLTSSAVSFADGGSAEAAAQNAPLRFKDGKFKILQLTDLHLEYRGDDGLEKAEKTFDVARNLLDTYKPDLAVLTGDIITCNPETISGGTEAAWDRVAAVFGDAKVPFVITFGNHDHERSESVFEQLKMIQKSDWNRTFSADTSLSGAGNCSLPILDSGDKEAYRLWFFDSHAYPFRGGLSDYDWIKFDQIEWFRSESRKFAESAGSPVPGLAFFHIPLPEYWNVHKTESALGNCGENPCSPELNTGLFTAFAEYGAMKGVFAGHDHVNDYIALYKGIALAYGRKTGFNSYGDLTRGGRLIELTEGAAGFSTTLVTPDGTENRFDAE